MLKLTLLLSILTFFLSSCEKTESIEPAPSVVLTGLTGKWHMLTASAGLLGSTSYNRGDITWTFNTINNTVDIRTFNGVQPVIVDGNYSYTTNGNKLMLGSSDEYIYSFDNGYLLLDGGIALDGPGYKLERD